MSLLDTLRADAEHLLETEIPTANELAKIVGGLLKRLETDVLKDIAPAPVPADPADPAAAPPPPAADATPAENLAAALAALGVDSVDAAVEKLDALQVATAEPTS